MIDHNKLIYFVSIYLCIFILLISSTTIHAQGTIVLDTVYSSSLDGNFLADSPYRLVNVYLPSGYEENQHFSYPVVYLLHGFLGDHNRWLPSLGQDINIRLMMDNLIVEGSIQPMIIVMPNSFNRWHGSWYTNSISTGSWEDYIVEDLIEYIDNTYRTLSNSESRGIAGHSMGGYGSFKIAMKHPNLFSSVFTLNAACISFNHVFLSPDYIGYLIDAAIETTATQFDDFNWEKRAMIAAAAAFLPDTTNLPFYGVFPVKGNGDLIDSVWARWLEHDPYSNLDTYKNNLLQLDSIWMDCARFDDLYEANAVMYHALDSVGIDNIVWAEYDGYHSDMIPQRTEEKLMPFFSGVLDGQYSGATAIPTALKFYPSFIKNEGDTLNVNVHLYNPESHSVEVTVVIHGENSAFSDSLKLFDDGEHHDSLAMDNIWGNDLWLSGLPEDYFTLYIKSFDTDENYHYNLTQTSGFTTIGPVQCEDWFISSGDTIPDPGDYLSFKLILKNNGFVAVAENVKAIVSALDTAAIVAVQYQPVYGDIAPGAESTTTGIYRIRFHDDILPGSLPYIHFQIDIASNNIFFWRDTFSVVVNSIYGSIDSAPKSYFLGQNYPNPFNPVTAIGYQLPAFSLVELSIYNLLGQKVAMLVSERQKAGYHQVQWDASGYPSGVYIYRLQAGKYIDTRKMILIR